MAIQSSSAAGRAPRKFLRNLQRPQFFRESEGRREALESPRLHKNRAEANITPGRGAGRDAIRMIGAAEHGFIDTYNAPGADL